MRLFLGLCSGSDLSGDAFWQDVDSVAAEINGSTVLASVNCTKPVQESEYNPFPTTVMTIIKYKILPAGEYEAELVFAVTMKNGDIISLC